MNLELEGTRALVTGGSRGIGRSTVVLLAQEGCSVEFCARQTRAVQSTETELTAAGHSVKGSEVDLIDKEAVVEWATDAVHRLGGLDIVVANASAMATGDTEEAWQQNYRVEIASLREILRIVHPYLKDAVKRRGDAAVVAIGSTAAGRAENADAYGAVKAALARTVKGLSRSLIKDGIRANMVSPGPIFSEDGVWGNVKREDPKGFKEKLAHMPLGRMGKPEEVANAVVFLCSPRARFIAGSSIVVDSGRSDHPQY